MPRRSTGVGRGNGAGSRETQFKFGQPSANPNGPRSRVKLPANAPIGALIDRILSEPIQTTENGVRRRRTQHEAMIRLLFARFPQGTVNEQLSILRFVVAHRADVGGEGWHTPDAESIEQVVAQLAEEARIFEEEQRDLAERRAGLASPTPR